MSDAAVQEPLQNSFITIKDVADMRVVENQWGVPTLVKNDRQEPKDGFAVPGIESLHSNKPLQVTAALKRVVQKAYPAACYQGLDDFAEERGLLGRPSEAYDEWMASKDAQAWLYDNYSCTTYGTQALKVVLEDQEPQIRAAVEQEMAVRQAEYDRTHPPLPEGCFYIDERLEELGRVLPDWADDVADYDGYVCDVFSEVADSYVDIYYNKLLDWVSEPGNYDYVENAVQEGLVDTQNFDMIKAIQMGQYEQIREEMESEFDHGDLKEYIALHQLKEAGCVAVSDDYIDGLRDALCDIDSNDQLSDIADAAGELAETLEVEASKPRYTLSEVEAYNNASKAKPIPSKKTKEKTPEAAERSAREQASAEAKAKDAQRQAKSRN